MTTDQGLGKGRYLKKKIEKMIMDENADFYKKHIFSKRLGKWIKR